MTIYKLCEGGLTTATFFSAMPKKPPAMKLHTAAILVIFWLGVFTEHMVKGSIGSQSMRRLKCVSLPTQQLNIRNLVSYEKRQGPVNAVIFMTTRGIKVCVSSNQEWVQTAIKKIDQKRATKGN
ncbi:cytokine SCM-1 beta-like [Athene cunicularia]|uniref:cytokine SCM-1 beta-like n=1 Tax=Athene cunicularia TaxID=194338 RepID=UPI000EF69743|nr:cytokine SCM-1 beta-like [Athene cunicularia]